MSIHAGRYKITGTSYAPHCPPNSVPHPWSTDDGWMQMHGVSHQCDEVFKFNHLIIMTINCVESTKEEQLGYPNNVNGGCGRDFEEYYTGVVESNVEGEYTVRIQLSESSTLTGDGTYWPWIRVTFNSATISYPGTKHATLLFQQVGGGPPIIESNIPDIMNQSVDILTPSATTYIEPGCCPPTPWCLCEEEIASILDHPVYFYVFFEGDWGIVPPPPRAAGALILPGQNNTQPIPVPIFQGGIVDEPTTSQCEGNCLCHYVKLDDIINKIPEWQEPEEWGPHWWEIPNGWGPCWGLGSPGPWGLGGGNDHYQGACCCPNLQGPFSGNMEEYDKIKNNCVSFCCMEQLWDEMPLGQGDIERSNCKCEQLARNFGIAAGVCGTCKGIIEDYESFLYHLTPGGPTKQEYQDCLCLKAAESLLNGIVTKEEVECCQLRIKYDGEFDEACSSWSPFGDPGGVQSPQNNPNCKIKCRRKEQKCECDYLACVQRCAELAGIPACYKELFEKCKARELGMSEYWLEHPANSCEDELSILAACMEGCQRIIDECDGCDDPDDGGNGDSGQERLRSLPPIRKKIPKPARRLIQPKQYTPATRPAAAPKTVTRPATAPKAPRRQMPPSSY